MCPSSRNYIGDYRDYVNFDPNTLRNNINNISWNAFYDIDDVNHLIEFFNNSILAVHDSSIPIRTVKRRKRYNTWFNDDIRKAILERDLAYKDWRVAPRERKGEKKHS